MIGKWEVTSNQIGDTTMYAVYRLRDVNAVDHSGNREYAGGYTENREACELLAKQLNEA